MTFEEITGSNVRASCEDTLGKNIPSSRKSKCQSSEKGAWLVQETGVHLALSERWRDTYEIRGGGRTDDALLFAHCLAN